MKRILAIALTLALVLCLFAACGSKTEDAGDSVTIGYVGTYDASYPSSGTSNDFITQRMIYDKLFEVDDVTGEYTSRTLSSWEWLDGKTLKMTLKDGMTFSDGNPVTGEDVLFSLYNYLHSNTTDKVLYMQKIDFEKSYVDGQDVYVVYYEEYGPAMKTLDVCIMEKAFTEAHEEADEIWFSGPVGSGPYMVSDWQASSYVTWTLREDYWNSDYTYTAKTVTLKFYSDETAMYVDYQNGDLDCIYNISDTVAKQIEAAGNQGKVEYRSNNDVTMLILNPNSEALSNPVLREAISCALDMDAIADVGYGSLAAEAKSHFAKNLFCYSEHEGHTYDPDRARELLAEAGYADGLTLNFIAVNMPPQPTMAEAVVMQLQAVGIQVNYNAYDIGTALPMYFDPAGTDLCFMTVNGGNSTGEPYLVVSTLDDNASFAVMSIHDATFNSYTNNGLVSISDFARTTAYQAADQWLYDNYLALPICETLSAYAYNTDVIASFPQGTVGRSCLGSVVLNTAE